MSKIAPFEMKQIIADYVRQESSQKCVHHPKSGYTPSVVRDTLERIDVNHPKPSDHFRVRAVKQCLSERGVPFDRTFRTLHAIFYLLDKEFPYEVAKKKARLIAQSNEHKTYWTSYVKPEHVQLLKAA